ncbi:MAG TPA: 2-C-methyl-D-erythritol 4-phosphate cytidylyltransferase, partial [Sphingomicrobium sp.]|nr:2-C-methyl-D-erythritol 4-phosphate cytidylyltransferase [Sphingomicrobium sp.]
MTTTALIVAAGSGSRMGGAVPKQFRLLGGKPVLRWAVESLIRHPALKGVRVVVGQGQSERAADALSGLEVGDLI